MCPGSHTLAPEQMKRAFIKLVSYSLICIGFACSDPDDNVIEDPTSYSWTTSSITPDTDLTVYKFKKSEDGTLYMLAWPSDNKSIFAKLVNNQWETLAEVDEEVIGAFAVFQDTVYFSTSLAVKRTRNKFVDTFLNTNTHTAIEVFQGKLFIGGSYLMYKGKDYSVLSYDDSKKVTPVLEDGPTSHMIVANQVLIMLGSEGSPLLMYDRGYIEESTYKPYKRHFLNIDSDGLIYSQEPSDANQVVITKFKTKKSETIGNALPKNSLENTKLQFYGSSIIINGQDFSDKTSNAFFLTTNNTWKPIDTDIVIYDLINYDGKIFAGSDGQILELTLQ